MADSLFSSDGIFAHDPGILGPVVKVVRDAGGIFVADEVQCGFARTGSHMWGYQRHDVVPDIISLGKPIGGNSVAMAAANATLEVVQGENLIENARKVGDIILSGLRNLMQDDERIGDVRGTGLYLGIEMVKNRKTREPDSPLALALVNEMRRRRVLISATAANANVLKIRPPLTFSADNAGQFLSELAGALKSVN